MNELSFYPPLVHSILSIRFCPAVLFHMIRILSSLQKGKEPISAVPKKNRASFGQIIITVSRSRRRMSERRESFSISIGGETESSRSFLRSARQKRFFVHNFPFSMIKTSLFSRLFQYKNHRTPFEGKKNERQVGRARR